MFVCGVGPLIMARAPRRAPMSHVLKFGPEQPFRVNLSVNKRHGRKQNKSNKTQTAESVGVANQWIKNLLHLFIYNLPLSTLELQKLALF